jgi:Uma2 family endonuclease
VLSPSNRVHDVLTKRALYGRAGVREYWIVDPEARTIEILVLDGDALHRVSVASGADVPESPLLGPLPFATADLVAGIDD